MNATQIENSFCQAVDIIVGEAVSKLQFDKTIQGTIIECVDQSIGKYKIRYQDSHFYAYAENVKNTYTKGQEVYVIIPSNDFSSPNKMIRGTVRKLGSSYITSTTLEDTVSKVGVNLIQSGGKFGLNSYRGKQEVFLYQKGGSGNLINIREDELKCYCADMKQVLIGASFQTELNAEQQFGGYYGLRVSVNYYDNIGQAEERIVTRNYILDVDQMTGNPYKYIVPTRQFGLFDVDGANMIEIVAVSIFCQDFPYMNENIVKNDIFVKDLEFQFVEPFTEEEVSGTSVKILTPFGALIREGETEKRIDAEMRVQGLKVNYDTQNVQFYWFIEDMSVDSSHPFYYKYGGQGWRCLNSYNVVSGAAADEAVIYNFKPMSYQYTVKESECNAYETKYKCVAISGDTAVSDTVVIYNDNTQYSIELVSTNGSQFYYDNGVTDLICNVYQGKGEDKQLLDPAQFTYSWGSYNEFGAFTPLLDKTENIYYNLYVNTITTLATYKCTIIKDNKLFGTASIVIKNSLQTEGTYSLIINNGVQVFKYNENGTSPAASSNHEPLILEALSFDIYNNVGQILDKDVKEFLEVKWTYPTELTMLTYDDLSGDITDNGDGTSSLRGSLTFVYGIANKYNINNMKNEIVLEVTYKDAVLSQSTNFTFTKEGELGTNGTDYTCRITPIQNSGKVWIDYAYGTEGLSQNTPGYFNINTTNNQNIKPFRAQLWVDNELIYDSESNAADGTVVWSLVSKESDNDFIIVNPDTGEITIRNWSEQRVVNILKAKVDYNDQTFYATYPISVYCHPVDYKLQITDGFEYCTYESDGTRSKYNQAKPFTLSLIHEDKEIITDVKEITWGSANIKLRQYKEGTVVVNYKVKGTPPNEYDGLIVNNYVKATFTHEEQEFLAIVPIHLYLNRQGLAALSGWDGNSIQIDGSENYLLTPQVGAGVRNMDNTFTGLIMGKSQSAGSDTADVGLLGYESGKRTVFIDAQTGKIEFGKADQGQIIIDSANSLAKIKSGNYSTTNKTGFEIDFNNSTVKYGSGSFEIDGTGKIVATDGKIGNWDITPTGLSNGSLSVGGVTLNSTGINMTAAQTMIDGKNITTYLGHSTLEDVIAGNFEVGAHTVTWQEVNVVSEIVTEDIQVLNASNQATTIKNIKSITTYPLYILAEVGE